MAKEITIPHPRAFIAALAVVPVSTTLSMVYGTQFVGKFFFVCKIPYIQWRACDFFSWLRIVILAHDTVRHQRK